jgi:uncharacterized protein (UPF0128 family)
MVRVIGLDLIALEKVLGSLPEFEEFSRLEVTVMKENKKDTYFGTSVLKYIRETDEDTGESGVSNLIGTIYLNRVDIGENEKLLLDVITEEAVHLLGDKKGYTERIRTILESRKGEFLEGVLDAED